MRYFFITVFGLILGLGIGYFVALNPTLLAFSTNELEALQSPLGKEKHIVIGFLPYWLLRSAQDDYSPYVNRLAYFSLTPDTDGSIKKLDNPLEQEPGWYSLNSGKADKFFSTALKKHQSLSLVIFSGDNDVIAEMISDPVTNAQNLMRDVLPLMKRYGFSDLNLDIEHTGDTPAEDSRNFTIFAGELKHQLNMAKAGTLTVDITGNDLIRDNLIDPGALGKIADYVVLMTYDYHFSGSSVTGPVAPLGGAGTVSEYDVQSAVQNAEKVMSPAKIILGVPLYGYEWESLGSDPRSAVLPGSGISATNKRIEDFLSKCSTCSAQLDAIAQETYLIYEDTETGTYHQIFYPTIGATQVKVDFAMSQELAGVALWALGYEGKTILDPLKTYK